MPSSPLPRCCRSRDFSRDGSTLARTPLDEYILLVTRPARAGCQKSRPVGADVMPSRAGSLVFLSVDPVRSSQHGCPFACARWLSGRSAGRFRSRSWGAGPVSRPAPSPFPLFSLAHEMPVVPRAAGATRSGGAARSVVGSAKDGVPCPLAGRGVLRLPRRACLLWKHSAAACLRCNAAAFFDLLPGSDGAADRRFCRCRSLKRRPGFFLPVRPAFRSFRRFPVRCFIAR